MLVVVAAVVIAVLALALGIALALGLAAAAAVVVAVLFPHLTLQKRPEHAVLLPFWLRNLLRVTTACTFARSQRPKAFQSWGALSVLTWKRASRHNAVAFLNISTSKGLSEHVVFLPFWLRHVLRATTCHNGVCFFHIWTSKSAPSLRCFHMLTSKSASRHNAAHFSIFHLPRWLRTRRFGELSSRPSGATKHWKNTVFRGFSAFSRTLILFLLTLSLLFSDSSHLCFFICPCCRSEVWLLNVHR